MSTSFLSNKFLDIINLIRFWAPTGSILLFVPCAIGTGLYSNLYDSFWLLCLFALGSFIMRSAGCIINDVLDGDIDKHVERTKNRPITAGKITIKEALIICAILSLMGLLILVQLSDEAIFLGLFSSILIIIYPLMKRITFWPQLFLGIIYNIGVLIAVAHIMREVTPSSLIAYIGCVFWTLYYDTIYAFMDLKDDKKIGVKSLARWLENKNYKLWLASFALIANFSISFSLLITNHSKYILFISLILSTSIIMWQIITMKINISSNCLIRFKVNNYLGVVWALASVIS